MKVSADISVLDSNETTTPFISGAYMGTATSQDSRTPSNLITKIQQNTSITPHHLVSFKSFKSELIE